MLAADPKNRFALDLKGRALRDLQASSTRPTPAADKAARPRTATDLKAAYLKVTIAEARRDYAGAAAAARGDPGPQPRAARTPPRAASNDRVFLVHLGFAYQQLEPAPRSRRGLRPRQGRRRRARRRRCSATRSRRCSWPRTTPRRSPRRARPGRASPTTPTWPRWRPTILREQGDMPGGPGDRRAAAREARPQRRRACWSRWPSSTSGPSATRGRGGAARGARRPAHGPAHAVPARRRARAPEAARRRPRPSSARPWPSSPTRAPVLNYLGYMNADRGVRVDEAAAPSSRRRWPSTPRTAPTSTAWAGRCSGSTSSSRPSRRCARRVGQGQPNNAVVLDHLGDVLQARGDAARGARATGRRRSRARTTSEELDRARVEREDPRGPGRPRRRGAEQRGRRPSRCAVEPAACSRCRSASSSA